MKSMHKHMGDYQLWNIWEFIEMMMTLKNEFVTAKEAQKRGFVAKTFNHSDEDGKEGEFVEEEE